jgi:hypothetical protein
MQHASCCLLGSIGSCQHTIDRGPRVLAHRNGCQRAAAAVCVVARLLPRASDMPARVRRHPETLRGAAPDDALWHTTLYSAFLFSRGSVSIIIEPICARVEPVCVNIGMGPIKRKLIGAAAS